MGIAARSLPRPRPRVRGAHFTAAVVDEAHKVVVRYCAGHGCRNPIRTHRVRQNINHMREYCSLVCYSRWSPDMRDVIARFPDYDQSPSGLETLIIDLKHEHGIMGAADLLGYSRSTVSYWLRKLQASRQFAGQPPETVLSILQDVAAHRGLEAAAKLIQVDPKTLQRAFEERDTDTQAEPHLARAS